MLMNGAPAVKALGLASRAVAEVARLRLRTAAAAGARRREQARRGRPPEGSSAAGSPADQTDVRQPPETRLWSPGWLKTATT